MLDLSPEGDVHADRDIAFVMPWQIHHAHLAHFQCPLGGMSAQGRASRVVLHLHP